MIRLIVSIIGLGLAANSAWAAQSCNSNMQASTPTADFIINNDGTVVHKTTGLMWKTCAEGLSGSDCSQGSWMSESWAEALNYVKTVNDANAGQGFASYNDWRLPNIKELSSIIEHSCSDPAINLTVFPNPIGAFYWSTSADTRETNEVFTVDFSATIVWTDNKDSNAGLRLVRTIK